MTDLFMRYCLRCVMGGALLLLVGCHQRFGVEESAQLRGLYYSGQLPEAAELVTEWSREYDDDDTEAALLCHLESVNVNFDAGRMEEMRESLTRSEKLVYRIDSNGVQQFHRPAALNYTGMNSDRLLLGMFGAFSYFEKNQLENALVELRKMRDQRFRYLLREADSGMMRYDEEYAGRAAMPYRMKLLLENELNRNTFANSGLSGELDKQTKNKRRKLSALFHPLAFYFSAWGYYWEDQFEEALIDLEYLYKMYPDNELFRRDYVTVLDLLGEPRPAELTKVQPWPYQLDDNLVMVIFAQGGAPSWRGETRKFQIPSYVESTWLFPVPQPSEVKYPTGEVLSAFSGKTLLASSVASADQLEVVNDEFWQIHFPRMTKEMAQAIETQTAAHVAAQAALAAALVANYDSELVKVAAIAAAAATVEATRTVELRQPEWRFWSTLAARYSLMHFPIPASRSFELNIAGAGQKFSKKITIGQETSRMVIYIREIAGKYYIKCWELSE